MTSAFYHAIEIIRTSSQAFFKFISANDLGLTGGHQSGYYISKEAAKILFNCDSIKGTKVDKDIHITWGKDFETYSHYKYYGEKSRDESRITTFGRCFEYMRPEYLGSLLVLAKEDEGEYCAAVLVSEEDIEEFSARFDIPANKNCGMIHSPEETAGEKLERFFHDILLRYASFPETTEMSELARNGFAQAYNISTQMICDNPDSYLLKWIDTEFLLFHQFEEKIYKPVYSQAFKNCQELIDVSNEILNRRKSRAGKSLEHHLSKIFTLADLEFEEQCITEDKKKPDFIFPGFDAYHNIYFPADDLVFLGAKTTCKDRWRQVLNEADRIEHKFLFTLQQGVSSNQIKEMTHENLSLVVPKANISYFAKNDRGCLYSLNDFISVVKEKQSHHPKSFIF